MRYRIVVGLVAAVGVLAAGCAHLEPAPVAEGVAIAPDRMLTVDGERLFVLGSYENPKDDAVLAAMAEAGFNLVRSGSDQAALDRLANAGVYAWANTGYAIDLSEDKDARMETLRAQLDGCASHPALLVWEVPDEALWNCWHRPYRWRNHEEPEQLEERIAALEDAGLAARLTAQFEQSRDLYEAGLYAESEAAANAIWTALGEEPKSGPRWDLSKSAETAAKMCAGMIEGYHVQKELDPAHPVWMNHAPRNQLKQLAAFAKAADIVGCDIYPAPHYRTGHTDLVNRGLSSTGAYTDIMQASAPGKPVWMVLQGCGWVDIGWSRIEDGEEVNRRPNARESRFMAYDAVVHGARGILYWGTTRVEKDSEFWRELLALIRELADLQPVLSAPDAIMDLTVDYEETMASLDKAAVILPKQVGDQVWLIVVNENDWPVTCTVSGFAGAASSYEDTETGDRYSVTDGSLTMTIRGQGVRVLGPTGVR